MVPQTGAFVVSAADDRLARAVEREVAVVLGLEVVFELLR